MPEALATKLVMFLRASEPPLAAEVDEDTSLLRSGLLDSLSLFRLLEWVEDAAGTPVDATAIDILTEWDTPRSVAAFVAHQRGA